MTAEVWADPDERDAMLKEMRKMQDDIDTLSKNLDEALRLRARATAAEDALEQVKAALGDRLLGKGPLSPEYAHAVMRQINDALRAAGRLP